MLYSITENLWEFWAPSPYVRLILFLFESSVCVETKWFGFPALSSAAMGMIWPYLSAHCSGLDGDQALLSLVHKQTATRNNTVGLLRNEMWYIKV